MLRASASVGCGQNQRGLAAASRALAVTCARSSAAQECYLAPDKCPVPTYLRDIFSMGIRTRTCFLGRKNSPSGPNREEGP
jgi:hypothetical protein